MNILERLQDDIVAQKHLSNGLRYLDTDKAIKDPTVVAAATAYYKTRALRPDRNWLSYESLGLTNTREYKLVKHDARQLKKSLKNYHTKRKSAKEDSEQSGDSPEES